MTEKEKDDFYVQKTKGHADRVREIGQKITFLTECNLMVHDNSKFNEPEFKGFRDNVPELQNMSYMSNEYNQIMKNSLKDMVAHHYSVNRHHPEHFKNGIDGMTLMDIIEMLADWMAAGERTKNGSIEKSIDLNTERFNISPQLKQILINTVNELNNKEDGTC